ENLTGTDPFDRVPTLNHHKVYQQELKRGLPYLVEMSSSAFFPLVRIEDSRGIEVRRDSSFIPNRPVRVVLFPERSDKYRIIASSAHARQTGAFTLTVSLPGTV